MKRRREMELESTEIRRAIEELSMVVLKVKPAAADDDNNSTNSHIPTLPFLSICNLLLQVLDKIGPTMAVLRQDIQQNIQRLEKIHDSDPSLYSNVVEILKKEISEGMEKKGPSCSKAFVWLTRFCVDATDAIVLVDFRSSNEDDAFGFCYCFRRHLPIDSLQELDQKTTKTLALADKL